MTPHLEHIRHEIDRVTSCLSKEAWLRAPNGKWNSALILEHLLLSYTGTTRGLLKTMQGGQPLCAKPTLRDRVLQLFVIKLGFFPSGRPAPKQTTPKGAIAAGAVQAFQDALVAMDASLGDAEKRFGSRVKILDHPVLGPLTVEEWRRFHRTHAMHHLTQIREGSRAAPRDRTFLTGRT